jgi:predicted  nucleic acid-binding Zn-ribbon protein
MTSVKNLFSNLNDLSKPKTIIDTPANYDKNSKDNILKISLQQGSKFKTYQNKIIKKTKPLNNLENPYDRPNLNNLKEGFQGLHNLDLNENGLAQQSTNIIEESDYSGGKENIDQLRSEYNATLKEYQTLTNKLQGATSNFFDRINSNNPFLNKTIRFTTGHICYVTNQGVAKYIPSQEIWNSVNVPKQSIQLDIPWHDSYSTPGTTIDTKPPLLAGTVVELGQTLGNEGTSVFVSEISSNPQDKYIGCYNDKSPVTEDADRAMTWNSYTDFDTCKKYASENGYTYFGQQSAKPDGTAACLVSNDLETSQKYGIALKYNSIVLWDTKTTGENGASAILTTTGSISVINSEGTSVFSSDNSQSQPGNYLGCYLDQSNRALNPFDGNQIFNLQSCQQKALDGNFSYFGLQNSTSGNNAQCGLSNDLSQALRYGKAGNCTKLSDGTWSGGAWSNAIYNVKTPDSNYFLILQDDGNMCIYRGTGPNDNQGNIWCSQTNGKQRQPNSNFAAANGKYAKNWISSGATLAAGDFIGSNNGSIYLIMQTDGNLVLYTSTNQSACSANKNGKTVGGDFVNALYEITPSGTKEDAGKIGYINENSELREYDSDNIVLTNNYTVTKNAYTYGNDIPGAMYGNATVDQCKSTCNGNKDCYGFVFYNSNKLCLPKTSGMYPYGGPLNPISGVDTYVREKRPINRPFGISDIIKNIDTVLFRNYIKGTGNDEYYGLKNATNVEKQKISELQGKLDNLASRIAKLSNTFSSGSVSAQTQSKNNISGLENYLSDLKNTNEQIQTTNTGMTRIINESDIIVLQKNYTYLFWTILATGTVLVTMSIAKKQ